MKKILFIIMLLLALVVAGCKSVRHTTEDVNVTNKEKVVYVTKDSIITIHDTTEMVKYVTQYIEAENTLETTMMEWWDNYTKEWTDSMGNVFKETYQKGNKHTTQTDQSRYIGILEDSLSYYKAISAELENSLADVAITKADSTDVTKVTDTEPEKTSLWARLGMFFAGILSGFMVLVVVHFSNMYKKESD